MVVLYASGRRVGTWAEAEHLFAELAKGYAVEFRDEAGNVLARTAPPAEPLCPWEPTLTAEESDRRSREGGTSLAEFWKRMGVE